MVLFSCWTITRDYTPSDCAAESCPSPPRIRSGCSRYLKNAMRSQKCGAIFHILQKIFLRYIENVDLFIYVLSNWRYKCNNVKYLLSCSDCMQKKKGNCLCYSTVNKVYINNPFSCIQSLQDKLYSTTSHFYCPYYPGTLFVGL